MAGTKIGGQRAAATNKAKHGENFYREIGARGGAKKSPLKGFGANRELARRAGAIGGAKSRRTGVTNRPKQVVITHKPTILDKVKEKLHVRTS